MQAVNMASIRSAVTILSFTVPQVLASCAYGTHLFPRAEGQVEVNTFGYTGDIGPLNWASLDPAANALCSTGTRQSPIDMVAGAFNVIPGSSLNINIPDMTEGAEFENLGTTVEVLADNGGSMSVGGVNYTLRQFHFHLPSEHLDSGTSMAMEMHMVWESDAQQIAVIGTYIGIDEASPAVAATRAIANAPAQRRSSSRLRRRQTPQPALMGVSANSSAPVSSPLLETVLTSVGAISTPGTATKTPPLIMSEIVSLLSAGSFQSYMGSLTTPPCSEGVQWLVSTQELSVQASTFVGVRDVIGFNSRFTQNRPGEPNVLEFARAATA